MIPGVLGIPFFQTNFLLSAQLPQNCADLRSSFPKKHTLTVLWYKHNVILADTLVHLFNAAALELYDRN